LVRLPQQPWLPILETSLDFQILKN